MSLSLLLLLSSFLVPSRLRWLLLRAVLVVFRVLLPQLVVMLLLDFSLSLSTADCRCAVFVVAVVLVDDVCDRRCPLLPWSQSFASSSHKSVISAFLNFLFCADRLLFLLGAGVADDVSGTCFGARVAVLTEVALPLRSAASSGSTVHVVYTVTAADFAPFLLQTVRFGIFDAHLLQSNQPRSVRKAAAVA